MAQTLANLQAFEELEYVDRRVTEQGSKILVDVNLKQFVSTGSYITYDQSILGLSCNPQHEKDAMVKSEAYEEVFSQPTAVVGEKQEAMVKSEASEEVISQPEAFVGKKHPRHVNISDARSKKEQWESVGGPSKHMNTVLNILHDLNIVRISMMPEDFVLGKRCIGRIASIEVLDAQLFAKHMFRKKDEETIGLSIVPYPCDSKLPWKTVVSVFKSQGFQHFMPKMDQRTEDNYPVRFLWSADVVAKVDAAALKESRRKSSKRHAAAVKEAPPPALAGGAGPWAEPVSPGPFLAPSLPSSSSPPPTPSCVLPLKSGVSGNPASCAAWTK